VNSPERIDAPVVVVGGGIAGLTAALALEGCALVADGLIGEGSSQLAQGGIAAAIGAGDSPAQHAEDTRRVGAGLTDAAIAALVTDAAPGRIDWLERLGTQFDRDASGALRLGREAGHGHARIVHAGGDRTGASVMQALRAAVLRRPDIRVLEGFELVDLLLSGGRAAGVLLERADGSRLGVAAPQVVLATGGIGACFEHSTNPSSSRGSGLAAAARAGAALSDLEFVQFHPTALAVGGERLPLLTEALRGAGAVLLDDAGRRFMTEVHPDAELAPRDVVARAVAARRLAGREVLLDVSPVAELERRFPGSVAIARAAGLDPHGALPVTAAAHFHMGGIATDSSGATSLPGLYACGEVAATGLHGGNRLASNSLLEGLVFGERIARGIRAAPPQSTARLLEAPQRAVQGPADPSRLAALRHLVSASLGPLRDGPAMAQGLAQLAGWRPASRAEEDLAAVARLVLAAALARQESRGAHYRADFPRTDGALAVRRFTTPSPAALVPLSGVALPHPAAVATYGGAVGRVA
jgi:L-aspartate oxidase